MIGIGGEVARLSPFLPLLGAIGLAQVASIRLSLAWALDLGVLGV